MSENKFDAWATFDLSGQCRMQAKEQLDPEFSEFMLAVASRLDELAAAPDSTRTGQREADEPVATVLWFDPAAHPIAENKPRKIIDASMAFMDAAEIGTKLYARPLAARPAAPEAQGAWREIDDEARNGEHWLVARVGSKPVRAWFEHGRWWMHGCGPHSRNLADLTGDLAPTHYQPLPASPAYSGQGGR